MRIEDFCSLIEEIEFSNNNIELIKKIANNPERFVGIFRITNAKTKLVQYTTQSNEIKFGNVLEKIMEAYFRDEMNFEIMDNRVMNNNGQKKSIDYLIRKEDVIYIIEQKVRDDHDSTKKVAQFTNFQDKSRIISDTYPNSEIKCIMWFIDPSMKKNEIYYDQQISQNNEVTGNNKMFLFYGQEFLNWIGYEHIWNNFIQNLRQWKNQRPDLPSFDMEEGKTEQEIDDFANQIVNLGYAKISKLFNSEEILNEMFPIFFPNNIIPNKIIEKITERESQEYIDLIDVITNYCRRYSET